MLRILFVCARNRLRSPTAEAVFADCSGVEVDSAGLNDDADVVLSPEQIEWADLILVMEKSHRTKLARKFRRYLGGKRIGVLEIPDKFDYMDPELVKLIKQRCGRFFPEKLTQRREGTKKRKRIDDAD